MTVATMQCDANYPTNGYPLLPGDLGDALSIDDCIPIALSATLVADWNTSVNPPCVRISQDTGAGLVEVPNNTDLHTLAVTLLVLGR
jgi:hypothetical protein